MGDGKKQPLEDRSFKMAAQFFGKEFLSVIGVMQEVNRIARTEQIHLEMKQFLEDFNFEMKDGSWSHFEFETDSITEEDLRRYRAYEAVVSYYYGVEVRTYVICTAKVKQIKRSFRQGENIYRIKVIRVKDYNADKILKKYRQIQKKRNLKRKELIRMLLTPLMDGNTTIEERIEKCAELLKKEQDHISNEDMLRMESLLYTFAVKFVSGEKLERIREVLGMTVLGQMLVDKGIAQGITQGITQGIERVAMNLLDVLDDKTISDKTGLSLEKIADMRKKNA